MRTRNRDFRVLLETEEVLNIEDKALAIVCRGLHLEYLIVDSQYQGRGYGKQLLTQVCRNRSTVTLDCENPLISYYEKQGFRCSTRQLYYRCRFLRIMYYGRSLTTRQLNQLVQLLTRNIRENGITPLFVDEYSIYYARSKPP